MNEKDDLLPLLDAVGDLPQFREDYWSRRTAAAGALLELDGLEARRGDMEPMDQQFLRFAECVAAAYYGLEDKEIAQAQETPRLMRYLADALGRYAANTTTHLMEQDKIATSKRYEFLANAFLASGDRGGKRGWTRQRIETAIEAYRSFLYEHVGHDKHGMPEWQARAFEAAYEKVFGDKVVEEKQVRENRRGLERELVKHAGMSALTPSKARRIKSI